jgi:hypothetical protein
MSNTTTVPVSELVSEDWQLAEEDTKRPTALVVKLRRRAHILPYFRLIHAEGDDSQVKIAFASHSVNVTGCGLNALLTAISTQSVVRLIQPTENEAKFNVRGLNGTRITGPAITGITVVRREDEEGS